MSNDTGPDVSYEPPTKEFIQNALLYGLLSEGEADSTFTPSQRITDGYSDLRLNS